MSLVLLWCSCTNKYFWQHVHLWWGPFWGYFWTYFLYSSISWKWCNIWSWNCVCSTLMVTWPKNMSCFPLLGAILGYFWSHVDICSSISWEPFNSFSRNFVDTSLMVTSLTKKKIWKFLDHVLLYFQAILAYVPLFLESHSIFSYKNVYICSWSYSDGQFTLTSCPSLLGDIFGFFWAYFSCSSISSELCNILS